MNVDQRIAIPDLADDLQVRKQRIFKILPRLGITTELRREPGRGNQMVATVSDQEAQIIRTEIAKSTHEAIGNGRASGACALQCADGDGYFYVIQLEPDHDPGRYKVGFTTDLDGRLRKHRCSAPFSVYVETWPCRRAWERAAIDCITIGCEQLHTEVFRTPVIDGVVARARAFL